MKKLLFALTAMVLLAASCVSEIREPEQMSGTLLSLTAAMEQPAATRTMVAGNGGVFWEKGDEIKVFAGTASGKFISDVASGTASTALFTGSLGGAWTEGSPLWAVYPYSDGASLEGETLTAVLPAVQTARGMSFAQNMNLSVARTTTASLQFYNVGGGVCFSLTEGGIRKVVFEGLNGEILSGKMKIAFQEDRPVVQEVVEGSTTVTLAAPEGQTLEGDGVCYYIVALPGTLEKGFKLSFYKEDAVAQKTFAKTVTVKRSIYGEVRNADEGVSYIPDTDENIAFKDAKVKSIVVRYFDTGKDGELSFKEAAAVRSFFVDEALTRADGDQVSVFAGTDIETFDEIVYFTGLTKIEDGAFAGCTQLTSITIPANITEIGANAFKGCTGLQSITIEATTPPTIGEGAFSDTNDCPIVVPAGTTETYTTAWGEYAPRIEGSQPDNEIWYTTSTGQILDAPYATLAFGEELVSHEYKDGKGVLTFGSALTSVGEQAFFQAFDLTSVKLPETVKTLGASSFQMCSGLTQFDIPDGVTTIGRGCFNSCQNLEEIILPDGITRLEDYVFGSCYKLSEIIIPDKVTYIGLWAFGNCRGLTGIDIPAGVTSIGEYAFTGCGGLTDIKIRASVPPAGGVNMFRSSKCPIYVPAGSVEAYKAAEYWSEYADRIQAIGPVSQPDNEIWYTSTDGQVVTPNTQTVFGATLVSNEYAEGKGVLTFDGAVTQIGDNAFRDCRNLASIQLPMSVTRLGQWAFMLCNNLVDIRIPASVTLIDECAIQGCQSLVKIQIPESVSQIGENAFNACTSLESIAIPASVIQIGTEAFGQVWSCTSIVVDPDNPVYDSRNDCNAIIETASNTLIAGCKTTVIPASVEILGKRSFFGCRGLVNLTIPSLVTQIGDYAFSECTDLVSATIPSSVTQIGYCAFRRCYALTSMTVLGEMPPQLATGAFQSCDKCIFYVPAGSVEAYKAAQYWSDYADRIRAIGPEPQPDNEIWYTSTDGQVVLPDDTGAFGAIFLSNEYNDGKGVLKFDGPVTTVGVGAFRNCGTLLEAILPKTVTTIGDGAFYNAAGLERVHIPKLVSSIGVQVFQKASSIARITVDPENVTYDSREDCNAIIHTATNTLVVGCKNSFIPNNIKRIGDYAFVFCADLTEITIPESVETIGISAFNFCENLTSVSIPSSVTSLGAYAFNSCTSLSGVTIYCQTPPEIGRSCFQNGPSYPIYVPTGLVETYKTAEGWSDYAKRILPMDPQARLNWEISYTSTDGEKVSPSFARYNIPADVAFGGALVVFNSYKDGQGKILFDRDVTELMNSFQLCTNLKTISLPESVTYIGAYTFAGCTNLTGTIKIPQGQVKISNALFSDCSSLEGVVIPEGVTSIGARVFSGCTSLTELTFPSSLKAISNSVASGCSGLTRITVLAETPPTGSSSMFTGSNCPIYVPAASVADYKTAAYWSDYADRIQAKP